MIKDLKKGGIKTYVFGLLGDYNVDYFLANEMDTVYGMYVNNWDFDNSEGKPKEKW